MSAWFKKLIRKTDQELDDQDEQGLAESEDENGQLALDVYQDKDDVIVKSTIAGVKPEDLDISISSDSVTIRGERRRDEEIKEEDYFYQECYWGAFSRTVSLPVEVDVDKAEADIKDGILTLTLPKAGRTKTKKVKVRQQEE